MTTAIEPGQPYPLGATPTHRGVNFSVYAHRAEAVELLLFDHVDDARPARVYRLDPLCNRTYCYWHGFVPGLEAGQIYAYRANGPTLPEQGVFHDPEKILLDPYGRAVAMPSRYSREAAARPGDNAAVAMKSVVVDSQRYDWEGDRPLRRPLAKTIVYELHVRGFTRHSNSGVTPAKRGAYAGLIEKISYLQDLGVTAVELMPIHHFDPTTAPPGLVNYWGYQPIAFFAPHAGYSSRPDPLGAVDEFRDMVKALHRAGIEVILDVVYNHTAEGFQGPATLSFRGLANDVYYMLDPTDKSRYADYTGCRNTFNSGHAVVRRLILDSLRYWVREMHVDGFRFDLASVLTRGEHGQPLPNPPTVWEIDSDPVLAGAKIIAEAWDAAGLYQVGAFPGDRWSEWNGKFRDDVRGFIKGDNGFVEALALRLSGSPDLYEKSGRGLERGINFLTAHDGFTLNDVVSYNDKHNEANGENNRDGANDNRSWNSGVEGPTVDPAVEALRDRQVKNFFTLLLLAAGVPMILMGDEARRTQQGNNNAYCHDSELTWFDWSRLDSHAGLHRFVKMLLDRRRRWVEGAGDDQPLSDLLRREQVQFHGVDFGQPDESYTSHTLALAYRSPEGGEQAYIMINAYWEPLEFKLPPPAAAGWRRWLDTSRPTPEDIQSWSDAPIARTDSCLVQPRSIVALGCTRQD